MRVVVIEEPGVDAALLEVSAKLEGSPSRSNFVLGRVRMLHDGFSRLNGMPAHDLLSVVELAVEKARVQTIASIDLIGHGSSGALLLGATAGNGPFVFSGPTREWTQIDCDFHKLTALGAFARRIRAWKEANRLDRTFEIRLLGCNTALDPGIVPIPSLSIVQDGTVLIHLLSSYLDVKVTGVVGYIGAEQFATGEFNPGEAILRSCFADTVSGQISFQPERLPPERPRAPSDQFLLSSVGAEAARGTFYFQGRRTPVPPAELAALLSLFNEKAPRVQTAEPLVIADAAIEFTSGALRGVRMSLVEHGKALFIRSDGKGYRCTAIAGKGSAAQEAVIRMISASSGQPPWWAVRS